MSFVLTSFGRADGTGLRPDASRSLDRRSRIERGSRTHFVRADSHVSRLSKENEKRARDTIGLYPQSRSALIPLLHLVQEQDGYLTKDGMAHVAELLGLSAAEVYGTASFYEMFKLEPVGKYLVNVCTNLSCMLRGGYDLLDHLEEALGIHAGGTTADNTFTLEEVECVAACTEAPCLQVNYRTFGPMTDADADQLVADLRTGSLDSDVPPHGTLNRNRQPARPVEAGTA